jgi:hypothetical protein
MIGDTVVAVVAFFAFTVCIVGIAWLHGSAR